MCVCCGCGCQKKKKKKKSQIFALYVKGQIIILLVDVGDWQLNSEIFKITDDVWGPVPLIVLPVLEPSK